MSRTHRTTAAVLTVALAITGCVKSTTFNPSAPPDTGELDRLQQTVNERPDLEPTKAVLSQLDTQIRAAIAKITPQTNMTGYGVKESLLSCREPYTWAVGREYHSA